MEPKNEYFFCGLGPGTPAWLIAFFAFDIAVFLAGVFIAVGLFLVQAFER